MEILTDVLIAAIPLFLFALIWFIRLEGKVKTNEKVFDLFKEQCKTSQDKIDRSIDELFKLVRDIAAVVAEIKGWKNGQGD